MFWCSKNRHSIYISLLITSYQLFYYEIQRSLRKIIASEQSSCCEEKRKTIKSEESTIVLQPLDTIYVIRNIWELTNFEEKSAFHGISQQQIETKFIISNTKRIESISEQHLELLLVQLLKSFSLQAATYKLTEELDIYRYAELHIL